MLRDSRSYEAQIIDAVRSVNKALGGTYGTSSAIHKNEFNQYEVQLIDAIKGIGRTLSGNGLSLAGGGVGGVTALQFQELSQRVTKLESESFFRLVNGNVTLKAEYRNLWVPGWLAAGGIGSESGGGTVEHLYDIGDVTIDQATLADGQGIVWDSVNEIWKNAPVGGVTVVDNLTSNSATSALSANQGRTLKSFIDAGYVFKGFLHPEDDSTEVCDYPVCYLSGISGVYYGYGNLNVSLGSGELALIYRAKNSSTWNYKTTTISGSGGGGSYSAGTGINIINNVISLKTASTSQLGGVKVDGSTITISNGVISAVGGGGGSTVSWGSSGSDYVYLSVNGTSKKLLTSHQDLSGYVTLATTQTITGAKTFTAPVSVDPSGNASSYIDIGNARLVYDSGTNALHITKKSGTSATIGLYADGFVSAGGISGQTTSSYVDLESNQTVGGNKTFTGTTQLGQTTIGSISILGSGTAPYINNTLDRIYIQRAGQTGVSMCATAGQVVIGALNTSNTSKLFVNGNAAFTYATGSTISISEIVSRIEALENA